MNDRDTSKTPTIQPDRWKTAGPGWLITYGDQGIEPLLPSQMVVFLDLVRIKRISSDLDLD
jgi:hypothetical protein